ncbi:MAG: type II toxin-antitoxin system HicA family toxin [Alphaproteobacteria bacterium]|nr:type II toxin-antitoxin system HicA family toxin [Alphaproteobacteria bacterium]
MPEGFYPDVFKELRSLGYELSKGGKGSHEKWSKPRKPRPILVPFNLVSRHTANAILKDAGSTKKF